MKQKKLIFNFFVNRNRKKLTDSRKIAKILADNRKSHHPIETLLLAVKVPCSNKRLIFPSILFTDNQWQKVVFEKHKKAGKGEKEICLRTTVETSFLNFFKPIAIVKQVVLLFSGINVKWPKVLFGQVFEKPNCNAFKNVMYNG